MFCPQCDVEYRPGFTECADCNVPLVEEAKPANPKERLEFVTVFQTSNEVLVSLAKAILDGENIKYATKGEYVQDLWGAGRFGTGFSPLAGPVIFEVEKEKAEIAAELLKDLERSRIDVDSDSEFHE